MARLSTKNTMKKTHQDYSLIKGILRADEQSLHKFYMHYKPRLTSYIKRKIAKDEDVEEIVQDIFIATLDALRDFAFQSSLYTFICSIANHKVIDFYRR